MVDPSAFGGLFDEVKAQKEKKIEDKEKAKADLKKWYMTSMVHYMYNLSFSSNFTGDICKNLPQDLYLKTLRNKDPSKKQMLNPDLDPESVDLILKVLVMLILRP